MKKISRRSFLAASGLLAASTALTACGSSASSTSASSNVTANFGSSTTASGKHKPITLMLPFGNITPFLEAFNAKYPDIDLQILPYTGWNTTAFVQDQLTAGEVPDIYFSTVLIKGENASKNLLDLSTYPFVENYTESFLRSVQDDGAVYMLPSCYNAIGITYNKTLLESHGWELPTSMKDMDDLAQKVQAAGCDLSITLLNLPGYGFQYLFNTLSAGWFSTLEGLKWQDGFLNGDATVSGTPEMMEDIRHFQHYVDLGLLNAKQLNVLDPEVASKMCEGNTLFMFGSSNNFFAMEGLKDTFRLMPFLSEDGAHNVFISNVSRYFGLSKKLEEKGNEQKLADALTVMEYISTAEGMGVLCGVTSTNYILPLRDYTPPEDSFFLEIKDRMDSGMVAPLIISGRWENTIVEIGNKSIDYISGNATLDELVKTIDDSKKLIDSHVETYTTATEMVDTDACTQWIGIAYTQASGADAALMSQNKWYQLDSGKLNFNGVNGCLLPLPITDQQITSVLPHGWNYTLETVQLTGKEINDLLAEGYDKDGTGEHNYPYTLVAKPDFVPEEDKSYTIVYAGLSDAMRESHEVTDTGIKGLDAAHTYLSQFDTFSAKDIRWN